MKFNVVRSFVNYHWNYSRAEEDARLAKELAERFDKGLEESMMNNLVSSPVGVSNLPSPSEIGRHTIEHVASSSSAPSSSTSQFPKIKNDLQEKSPPASRYYSQDHNSTSPGSSSSSGSEKKMKSIMKPAGTYRDKEDKIDWSAMGACGYSAPVSPPLAQGTVEKNCNLEESDLPYSLDEEGQRLLQEKLDEVRHCVVMVIIIIVSWCTMMNPNLRKQGSLWVTFCYLHRVML